MKRTPKALANQLQANRFHSVRWWQRQVVGQIHRPLSHLAARHHRSALKCKTHRNKSKPMKRCYYMTELLTKLVPWEITKLCCSFWTQSLSIMGALWPTILDITQQDSLWSASKKASGQVVTRHRCAPQKVKTLSTASTRTPKITFTLFLNSIIWCAGPNRTWLTSLKPTS